MNVRMVLLCEDQNHEIFVRRFLSRRFKPREVRSLVPPAGSQSGEQWVRSKYPVELDAIRDRQNVWLFVVIDADMHETSARRKQLARACEQREVAPRTRDDPVATIVPRRNIETWFEYLNGRNVDEVTAHPKRFGSRNRRRLADELFRMCHVEQRLRPNAPDSLVESCDEYARFKPTG